MCIAKLINCLSLSGMNSQNKALGISSEKGLSELEIKKKKITFYESLSEQQAAEDEYVRSLSSEERIRQSVELIRRVYKDELSKNTNQKIITFPVAKP